eukprot:8600761-Alexandrium_andersonii.AAC.1
MSAAVPHSWDFQARPTPENHQSELARRTQEARNRPFPGLESKAAGAPQSWEPESWGRTCLLLR